MSAEREINDDITVVFGKTITNEGLLYQNAYGQFVCVDDDVYVFLWSTTNMKGTRYRNALVLQKTGQDVKYGPRTSAHGSYPGGVATMLSVSTCRSYPPTAFSVRTDVEATFSAHYTSFSGFRLASTKNAIAFTAELSHTQKLFPNLRLRFDRVLQNHGHAYNPMHGYFRCPDNGVYAFFLSTQGPYDYYAQWSHTMLMKHGEVVMEGPETYRSTSAADSGSSSILATLQCEKGKDIYVQSNATNKNTYYDYLWFDYNIYGELLTTFSGFKLFNEYSRSAVAFTAVMSKDHIWVAKDSTLIFDKVITNVGEAYIPLVGFFICPDSDVYLFSWSAVSSIGGYHLDLTVDDVPVKQNLFSVQTAATTTGNSGTSTMAVILKCSPQKRMQIMSSVATIKNTLYIAGGTSFSAFKIPSDYDD